MATETTPDSLAYVRAVGEETIHLIKTGGALGFPGPGTNPGVAICAMPMPPEGWQTIQFVEVATDKGYPKTSLSQPEKLCSTCAITRDRNKWKVPVA